MEENEQKRLEELRARNREITCHSGAFSPTELIERENVRRYSVSRIYGKLFLFLGMVLLTAVMLAVLAGVFLRVDNITVTDETDFSAEEIRKASGISIGQNLFLLDKNAAARRIARNVPYADHIVVSKRYPNGVRISLSRGEGMYYVQKGRDYYVLSEEKNVLARTDDIESIELAGYVRLDSSKISRCVAGEKLTFSDGDMEGMFDELCSLLKDHGLFGFCSSITFNSKFDVRFLYRGRITVKLGDLYDLDIKLRFAEKIMEKLGENDSGEIDVSDRDLHEGVLTLN